MVNNNIGIADLDVRTFAFLVHSNTGHTESSKRKTSHLITFSGVKDCKVPWTNLSLVQGFFFTFYVDIVGETLGNTAHHGQRTHHALNLNPAMPMVEPLSHKYSLTVCRIKRYPRIARELSCCPTPSNQKIRYNLGCLQR